MSGDKYREAGVDIEKGNQVADRIKSLTASEDSSGVVSGVGGFGAVFKIPKNYQNPVFIAATDGVGTKLKLAKLADKYDTVGIDLVAMNVNDILAQGGKPLFFLDYIAMDALSENMVTHIIEGIVTGCNQSGCQLVGGETAEMPGFYQNGLFDLAGFCVGVAEENDIIDGSQIDSGNVIVGIGSDGIHSNGMSLARKVLLAVDGGSYELNDFVPELGKTLQEELLTPTRVYVNPILELKQEVNIHGMAHITGGGLPDNLSRVLPSQFVAKLNKTNISSMTPSVFELISQKGKISFRDMIKTFNMGVGFALILPKHQGENACKILREKGETAEIIGSVYHFSEVTTDNSSQEEQVIFSD